MFSTKGKEITLQKCAMEKWGEMTSSWLAKPKLLN